MRPYYTAAFYPLPIYYSPRLTRAKGHSYHQWVDPAEFLPGYFERGQQWSHENSEGIGNTVGDDVDDEGT